MWKLNEGVNREFQITFLKGGFFEYSKDGKKIGGLDSKWTWKLDGKSITFSEANYIVPVFINEAAYLEKNIAMAYTKKEVWPFDKK